MVTLSFMPPPSLLLKWKFQPLHLQLISWQWRHIIIWYAPDVIRTIILITITLSYNFITIFRLLYLTVGGWEVISYKQFITLAIISLVLSRIINLYTLFIVALANSILHIVWSFRNNTTGCLKTIDILFKKKKLRTKKRSSTQKCLLKFICKFWH